MRYSFDGEERYVEADDFPTPGSEPVNRPNRSLQTRSAPEREEVYAQLAAAVEKVMNPT